MNNQEAIEILKGAIKKPNTKDGYLGQALTMGIEALENQTSVIAELERLEEEIEQDAFKDVNGTKYIFINRVNQIIDKYKAELKGELMRDFFNSFKVECPKLGMAGCGCFTKEDLTEVGNGFLMQRPKLKEEELCFKCKEYLTDERIAELKGENRKDCSTCKSDNSHENCLGCIEYGHWKPKGENNE